MKKYLSLNGVTKYIEEWARATGIKAGTITSRLNKGWTVEEALTLPVDYGGRAKHISGTLCWRCARTAANCPWMRKYRPIEGWTANVDWIEQKRKDPKTKKIIIVKRTKSYCVRRCPLFKKGRD